MEDKPSVGFVGIGNMGWPMAACLVRASFPVHVNDSRRESFTSTGKPAFTRQAAIGQPILPTPTKPTVGLSAISLRLSRCRRP